MNLAQLSQSVSDSQLLGDDVDVTDIACDSRAAAPGTLFVALVGAQSDGHDFIPEATNRGATALVIDRAHGGWYAARGLPVLVVPDTRRALPALAATFFGDPSRDLDLIGVTGTNGKTTTTLMVESIFRTLREAAGYIGTLGAMVNGKHVELERTTPESPDLQRLLAEMRDAGVKRVALEVSSEGVLSGRTSRCAFDTGVFTNLTQDHLNTHGTMDAYFAEKLRLFTDYPDAAPDKPFSAVVNSDDAYGRQIIAAVEAANRPVLRYALENPDAELRADIHEVRSDGTRFTAIYRQPVGSPISMTVALPMGGLFNVSNALAAMGVALLRRVPPQAIINGLESLSGVPGRFETVPTGGKNFAVVVDYAHSPDGLENVLRSARALRPSRLLCIFGCGGDRDAAKRPLMGEIAARLADLSIVTSDNPRSENPDAIIGQILAGIDENARKSVTVEADRREAIRRTLCETAQAGDLIVIAGKGHEAGQIFIENGIKRVEPFDDRRVAREVLGEC